MLFEQTEATIAPIDLRLVAGTLADETPRSLLTGRTAQRNFFHVYLDAEGVITRVIYDQDLILVEKSTSEDGLTLTDCFPGTDAYPDHCDREFFSILLEQRVVVPFTTGGWTDRYGWLGLRVEQLITQYTPDDFKVNISIGLADLGVPQSADPASTAWLSNVLSSNATGYLRARAIHKSADASLWLSNIALLVENYVVKKCSSLIPLDFIERVHKICQQVVARCEERIKELTLKTI